MALNIIQCHGACGSKILGSLQIHELSSKFPELQSLPAVRMPDPVDVRPWSCRKLVPELLTFSFFLHFPSKRSYGREEGDALGIIPSLPASPGGGGEGGWPGEGEVVGLWTQGIRWASQAM